MRFTDPPPRASVDLRIRGVLFIATAALESNLLLGAYEDQHGGKSFADLLRQDGHAHAQEHGRGRLQGGRAGRRRRFSSRALQPWYELWVCCCLRLWLFQRPCRMRCSEQWRAATRRG